MADEQRVSQAEITVVAQLDTTAQRVSQASVTIVTEALQGKVYSLGSGFGNDGEETAIPTYGDRSARRVSDYPNLHADDIADGAGLYHWTWAQIWAAILANDGAGSGLDADLLDGQEGAWYLDLVNSTGELDLAKLAAYVRGYIIRGGAADWEAYDASADGFVLIGDGTDVESRVLVEADISDLDHTDVNAIHDNVASEISAIANKAAPVAGDMLVIEDSEAANIKKMITLNDLPLGDHAHAGVAGDGSTFDAANLTSGASTDGQVLTSNGAGGSAWEDAGGGDGNVALIFSQIADVTVANTADETSILGAGRGSKTIPADTLDVGTVIRLTLYGYFSDTGTPTLNVKVELGGTEVCSTGVVALPSGIDELGWSLKVDIACRSTGAAGTVVAGGVFEFDDDSGRRMVKAGTTAADTTAALLVDVTDTWGAAAAGNTKTCQMATIELLKADDLAVAAPMDLTAVEV